MTTIIRRGVLTAALAGALMAPQTASAQLDPLLYLKRTKPTVLIAVDTSNRMQRDTNGDYRDDNVYQVQGGTSQVWEDALGITPANTSTFYRRKYVGLINTDSSSSGDRFAADHIEIVGDRDPNYSGFDRLTRISIARQSLTEAINRNSNVVRFGLLRMRQNSPAYCVASSSLCPAGEPFGQKWMINERPVTILNGAYSNQQTTGDYSAGRWRITRPVVGATNGSVGGPVAPLVAADSNANSVTVGTSITNILALPTGAANSLLPSGRDQFAVVDAPVDNMLDDLKTEAARLIAADPECRNTVAILVVGGGEGDTSGEDPVAKAAQFLNVSSRRIPIHVIGIAPLTAAELSQLQSIASTSGGRFTEITAAMVAAVTPGQPIPELVEAVNFAVSHTFVDQGDFDLPPDIVHPYGYSTSHQVTSPIVGTVDLRNAQDITGATLPDTYIEHPVTHVEIPQRSNVIVTTGYTLPGFTGLMQAARVYKPVADSTKSIGYKFVSDATKLWVASAPAAALRNIYTSLPDGTIVAFTSANAGLLRPYLRASTVANATTLIDFIRAQPLGAFIGSTPAIMDAPSLDPPPDADYPGFADANSDRRSIIWAGANDGMMHAIDGRFGQEVWAFIPFNLLPKLKELRNGQPVGDFRYFMDGSPKIADVKVGGQWRTYLVVGQGPGGTFYQTFDVTLPNIGSVAPPAGGSLTDVLTYFASPTSVPLKWAFPSYQHFDYSCTFSAGACPTTSPWGDIATTAPAVSKTVGETWSDPAVGQVGSASSPFVVLTGSGFFRYSRQLQANRGGVVAGNTFYLLDMATGAVLDSRSVGNDGKAETVDNCAASAPNDCRELKNALQADPVATGPNDSRYISKVYIGDLDGKFWRFDLGQSGSGTPAIQQLVSLYTIGSGGGKALDAGLKAWEQPIFSSMATVSIGYSQQYLFVGTGSDLLPRNGVTNTQYALLVLLDQGSSGSVTAVQRLEVTDGAAGDEKVTSFPAVAGDIVFFSTTTYKALACSKPDANLYALTFIGGPAYDTNNSGSLTSTDSTRIRQTTGARATAPFIVDQHLVFGTGKDVELFGDPEDFNNGVGQAGVRILSWREVR
jgi:hypothetical protein